MQTTEEKAFVDRIRSASQATGLPPYMTWQEARKIADENRQRGVKFVEIVAKNPKRFHSKISRCFEIVKENGEHCMAGVLESDTPDPITGQYKFKRTEVSYYTKLDMTVPEDVLRYNFIKWWSELEGSPREGWQGPVLLQEINTFRNAQAVHNKLENVKIASKILEAMSLQAKKDFARLMGIDMTQSDFVIQSLLEEKVLNFPGEFIQTYNQQNREIFEIVRRAKETGILEYRTNGIYYRERLVGATEHMVVAEINRDHSLLSALDYESKVRAGYGEIKSDLAEEHTPNSVSPEPDESELLLEKAKELGIKYAGRMSTEKLRQNISAAEDRLKVN